MSLPDDTPQGNTQPGSDAADDLNDGGQAIQQPNASSDPNDDGPLSDEDAAMEAAFQAASGNADGESKPQPREKPQAMAEDDDAPEGDDAEADDPQPNEQQPQANAEGADADDPVVPGLGMKASEVKAALSNVTALSEQLRTAHGKIGHLNSLVQNLGKSGKAITREQLKRVEQEFGEEFATSLAADLSEAGFGGGAAVDQAAVDQLVEQRVAPILQKTEFRAVRLAHKDAPEYFAGGKHHQEFLQWVGAQPAERQELLMNSWDADVIVPALDEFKAQRVKAVNQQARQTARVQRAVAPTQGRSAVVPQNDEDPMEAGFRRVAGQRGRQQPGARR